MKPQKQIGLIAGSLCLVAPFLSRLPRLPRLPRGSDWLAQYLPDDGHFILGALFLERGPLKIL